MGLKRLGIKNPSVNTDTLIYTADGMYLASIIATNKSTSTTANIRIWVVPSGATLTSQYAYLAYDQDIVPQNTLETHRFALNQNDVVYVRSDTADMSFMINGLKQVDLELDVSLATYSATAPENPIDGMLWVDKDGNGTSLPNAFLKQSGNSSGESSSVKIDTKPWNMPWGVVGKAESTSSNTITTTVATQLSSTINAVASRIYKITYYEPAASAVNGQYVINSIKLTSATGTQIGQGQHQNSGSSTVAQSLVVMYVGTLTAGSNVIVATALSSSGSPIFYRASTNPAYLIIEDIGPA
jgi:hypothetical protein